MFEEVRVALNKVVNDKSWVGIMGWKTILKVSLFYIILTLASSIMADGSSTSSRVLSLLLMFETINFILWIGGKDEQQEG